MNQPSHTVVGIDVGGTRKGFHAVALRDRVFETATFTEPAEIVTWCKEERRKVSIVAVDAPCGWSLSLPSRRAERELAAKRISTFATPTRASALAHQKGFYEWVFNGEKLYFALKRRYRLFEGELREEPICFETFPHAIVCALAGRVVPAKPKTSRRCEALRALGYDVSLLRNIDFVDAALCAVTAERFRIRRTMNFGTRDEGIIVVPEFEVGQA